jgi:single-strand DNA-binding protein
MTATAHQQEAAEVLWQNETHLIGRVAAAPERRELPSGDQIVVFRLIVPRVPEPETGQRVDTLDCVARTGRLRQRAGALQPDTVVEVTGPLRRRFTRGAGGAVSYWEVEIAALSRLGTAGPLPRRRSRERS